MIIRDALDNVSQTHYHLTTMFRRYIYFVPILLISLVQLMPGGSSEAAFLLCFGSSGNNTTEPAGIDPSCDVQFDSQTPEPALHGTACSLGCSDLLISTPSDAVLTVKGMHDSGVILVIQYYFTAFSEMLPVKDSHSSFLASYFLIDDQRFLYASSTYLSSVVLQV